MTRTFSRLPVVVLAALIHLGVVCDTARAGWITVTNDTKVVIVIQETTGPTNRPVRGKCTKLQPGEAYREYSPTAGTRNVRIYDAAALQAPLATETMVWGTADVTFSVRASGADVKLAQVKR